MAFSSQELHRIKRELGYHLLTVGSLPYIGYTQLFDSVINENIDEEVSTTTTLATAIAEASAPAPHTLTLASATGFSSGARVYVDVDSRQELATVSNLNGSAITVLLKKAHAGTIPVALEGPIPIARDILRKIEEVREEMARTFGDGAIRKVDEVEFFDQRGRTLFGSLGEQLMSWRDELASVLGVANGWRASRGGGSVAVSVY